jgi:ketosteroid isomerase-like protein
LSPEARAASVAWAMSDADVIARLYDALDRHDGEAMASLYAPDARFRDPAFGELSGEEAGDMWRMLTSRATDLSVELPEHEAGGGSGSAHWIATYTFRTGRHVVNDIRARFRFRDGLIAEHEDSFPFHRWARQALGPAGWVLGAPPFSLLVRRRALADLERFRAERAAGAAT